MSQILDPGFILFQLEQTSNFAYIFPADRHISSVTHGRTRTIRAPNRTEVRISQLDHGTRRAQTGVGARGGMAGGRNGAHPGTKRTRERSAPRNEAHPGTERTRERSTPGNGAHPERSAPGTQRTREAVRRLA